MRVRSVVFSVLALALAYGNPVRLLRQIPGDPGDAHLILSLLEWGGDRSTSLYSGYWDGPMFSAGRNVMAYTDTFLPLTIPFEIIARISGSSILAFNLLYLASWVLCGEATFRLARRYVDDERAAFVAAVAFTFSTIRLSGSNHFQLMWAGLIPLGFLLFFRFRDRPSATRGLALAAVLSAQFLTSAYYGVFLVVGIGGLAAIGLIADVRVGRWRDTVAGHTALGGAMVALFAPVGHWYTTAQSCAADRSFDVAEAALRPQNFLSTSWRSTLLDDAPIIGADELARSGENHAYVGFVVLACCVGLGVWMLRRRRLPDAGGRRMELLAIAGVGVATAAVGIGPLGYPLPMPYDLAAAVIPGIDAMGALGRLAIFVQLPLVLAVAVALDLLFRDRARHVALAVVAASVLVVSAEGLMRHGMVDAVEAEPGSVYEVLAGLEPGVAAEMPAPPRSGVIEYAFIESTRMALGRDDDVQTVNGYSGYAPKGYDLTVDDLNRFPQPRSIRRLRDLGVDYLVLHSAPLETGVDGVDAFLDRPDYEFAYFRPDDLDAVLLAMPFDLVERQFDADDGIVLVLTPGPDREPASSCDEA